MPVVDFRLSQYKEWRIFHGEVTFGQSMWYSVVAPYSMIYLFLLQGVLHFQIESDGLKWSYIFGMLERNKAALNIVDYSVSQTALEQVNNPAIYLRSIYCFTMISIWKLPQFGQNMKICSAASLVSNDFKV